MKLSIDLNADLGELPGEAGRASDRAILANVTSCAIACGGHAGDAETMTITLNAAREAGVLAGAHPSYPDRDGFGRVSIRISTDALVASLIDQMKALKSLADVLNTPLAHVKPHGALYNDASQNEEIAKVIVHAVQAVFGMSAAITCQPGFALARQAHLAGLRTLGEGFMDRAYEADGRLRPRSEPGAVLTGHDARIGQAKSIIREQGVRMDDGQFLALKADTICLHGDSPGAAETATELRAALEADGISVCAPEL